MPNILTVTLNPALDVSAEVGRVIAGPKLRCAEARIEPGGGGVNVARAIKRLGGEATALVAEGGVTGALLLDLLRAEGVPTVAFETPGLTRQSFAVIETETERQFRFVLPGPHWRQHDRMGVVARIDESLSSGDYIVLSGSLPPGVPPQLVDEINTHVSERGGRLVVDTSGEALLAIRAFNGPPIHLLRMDGEEAEALAGRPFADLSALAAFGRELVAEGRADRLVMSLAERHGALGVSADDAFFCEPPPIKAVSAVGAGDSQVGAIVLSLARGESFREAVRYGAAAAGAAVTTPATELCDAASTAAYLDRISIEDVAVRA